jgi:hypothetical protein
MLRRYLAATTLAVLLMSVAVTSTATATGSMGGAAKAHHKKHKKKKKKGKKKAAGGTVMTVTGGTVTLTPSAAAAAAFEAHKLTIEVTAPATTGAGDSVTLPITSGKLNSATGYGTLTLGGGYTYIESSSISIPGLGSLGGGASASFSTVSLAFGASSSFTADVDGTSGPFYALKAVKPASAAGKLTLASVPVSVNSGAVSLLNGFADPTTFTANGQFGTLTVEATT